MRAVNSITKTIAALVTIAILAAVVYAVWSIYVRIPGMREDIKDRTADAVGKWFPVTEEGGFSYGVEVDLKNDICSLKDLQVTGGQGRIINNINFSSYELRAESIDIELDSLLNDQPVRIIEVKGVELEGDIGAADIISYFTPDNSGIADILMDYDDFTGKTKITADIDEQMGIRVQITGKWEIDKDGALALTDRDYRNPDGPVDSEVIKFIEEHTNITIGFKVFDFTLDVTDFEFDGAKLTVELEHE
jgi:hypothetical protein